MPHGDETEQEPTRGAGCTPPARAERACAPMAVQNVLKLPRVFLAMAPATCHCRSLARSGTASARAQDCLGLRWLLGQFLFRAFRPSLFALSMNRFALWPCGFSRENMGSVSLIWPLRAPRKQCAVPSTGFLVCVQPVQKLSIWNSGL